MSIIDEPRRTTVLPDGSVSLVPMTVSRGKGPAVPPLPLAPPLPVTPPLPLVPPLPVTPPLPLVPPLPVTPPLPLVPDCGGSAAQPDRSPNAKPHTTTNEQTLLMKTSFDRSCPRTGDLVKEIADPWPRRPRLSAWRPDGWART